jgi:hypothetical protein
MKKNLVVAPLGALVISFVISFVFLAGAGRVVADEKNKCGCYKDNAGTCFCDKKAKCGCPGDCEPKGCEAARDKEIQKEIEAETKKAASADRKHPSGEDSPRASREPKAPSATGSLTPAQAKELVKLLDIYMAGNPDARTRNVEDVRKELSQPR